MSKNQKILKNQKKSKLRAYVSKIQLFFIKSTKN